MVMKSPDPQAAASLLERIRVQVAGLSPPVAAFEQSIRTTPFRVLISVLLSSRTRDPVTLAASSRLFALASTPGEMARLERSQVEAAIFPVGFYRQKAQRILEISRRLDRGKKNVSPDLDDLMSLPGVGRKTANLVRSLAFDIPAVAVDVHVFRISRRLGWARGGKPDEVEAELRGLFPPEMWNRINRTLVGFGQTLCRPRHPRCSECAVRDDCPWRASRKGENEKK